ncbi:MAG: sigma-70 family RNA polymerase sigma factor [Gemmataceae bacterium]
MAEPADVSTSPTLLGRLARSPTDQLAWGEFVTRYAPQIDNWCRRWGLQPADAQDVTQQVLLELARQMAAFRYDPSGSFRAWLKTVSYRAWCKFIEARRRPGLGSGDTATAELLLSVAAGDDLLRCVEQESERELLEQAMARVRLRVQPSTWDAFRLTALEEKSGSEVAQQLGMKVANVFVARSNVRKMIEQEIRRLDGDG